MRKAGVVIILIGSVLSVIPAIYALDLVYELKDEMDGWLGLIGTLAEDAPADASNLFAFVTDPVESALTTCWIMVFCSVGAILFSAIAARVQAKVAGIFVLLPLGIGAWAAYPLLGGDIRPTVFAYLTAVAFTGAGALMIVLDPAAKVREG